jgi:hypothetical protein
MFAVSLTVTIDPEQFESAAAVLRGQIIPRVSQQPGFVHGYWTTNLSHTVGTSLIVFSTREQADQAATMGPNTPFPTGATFRNVEVVEVTGEARGTPR